MRDTFSDTLVDAAKNNENVYLLTGDHGYALFDALRKTCPDRYVNAGIAEQNMVGVAAGMAKSGLIPIVYGLAAFIPVRVLEQIKLDICFENLKVILIGDGAGVVYSKLGVSHQCSEDIAAVRALPNLRILSPGDRHEMKWCLEHALASSGPTYIRVGKSDLGDIHPDWPEKKPGMHTIIQAKDNLPVIFATGSMVKVAKDLISYDLPGFGLVSVSQIKPMPEKDVLSAIGKARSVISLEEHSIYGGLGSALAEILTISSPMRLLRLGIEDRFTDKCGTYEYLMMEHGLDPKSLVRKIRESKI